MKWPAVDQVDAMIYTGLVLLGSGLVTVSLTVALIVVGTLVLLIGLGLLLGVARRNEIELRQRAAEGINRD